VKLLTIVARLGLFSGEQCLEIMRLISSKTHTLKSLEKIVERDSATIGETWIKKWRDDLIDIRLFSLEALYLCWIFLMDDEVIAMIKKARLLNTNALKKDIFQVFKFHEGPLYKQEFCLLFQEVFLGYQISNYTIKGVTMLSAKIKKYSGLVLQLFSNYCDQYLQGLNLLQDSDISMYFEPKEYSELDKFLKDLEDNIRNIYYQFYQKPENYGAYGRVVADFETEVRYNIFIYN
jgi:hypothetical protein